MAATYTLIASNTLSSAAASVTFSAIPGTYTDLVLRYSARSAQTGISYEAVFIQFNATSGNLYSRTYLEGTGAAVSSGRASGAGQNQFVPGYVPAANATSNTFGSHEIYIPNYTSTSNRPISAFAVQENNITSTVYLDAVAALYRDTSAISTITITEAAANNFVSGSSFFLYGIKNS